uniref:Uncharacterized protein n=1 Tax=Arundo donax TaxID=35708 RepID=A0A0A8Z3Z1_ARUDO
MIFSTRVGSCDEHFRKTMLPCSQRIPDSPHHEYCHHVKTHVKRPCGPEESPVTGIRPERRPKRNTLYHVFLL